MLVTRNIGGLLTPLAAVVLGIPAPAAAQCDDPTSGSCCVANGTPGCENEECCTVVCDADPFCCAEFWDQACADGAAHLCEICLPRYETTIDLPASILTDSGLHESTASGEMKLLIDPPDPQGIRGVTVKRLSLGSPGAPVKHASICPWDLDGDGNVGIGDLLALFSLWGPCPGPPGCPGDFNGDGFVGVGDMLAMFANWGPCPAGLGNSETGGMTFQMQDDTGAGFWDTKTGEFQVFFQFDVSYWLLDQLIQPGETDGDDIPGNAEELWGGTLFGQAFDFGDHFELNGILQAQVFVPITKQVFEVEIVRNFDFTLKQFNLPNCPDDKKCNKQIVCVQPVFIGMNANDPAKTGSSFADMKSEAETIWAKCCVELEFKAPVFVNNNAYKEIENYDQAAGRTERDNLRKEVDAKGKDDCIEVIFVEKFIKNNGDEHAAGDGTSIGGGKKSAKIIIADAAVDDCERDSDRVMAHELGHSMGNLPHTADTCMKATGASPNCPGLNPDKVSKAECEALNNPMLKAKDPKEECCKTWDA